MKRAGLIFLMIALAGRVCLPVMADDQWQLPAPAAVVINKAEQLLVAGKTSESIGLLESFQSKRETASPAEADSRGYNHYLIDFMLGNCRLSQKDPAAAVRHYQAAVERRPDFGEARFNLARSLYDLDRPAEAGREFVAAYETPGGQKLEALYFGAVCFMQAEDYRQALTVFERLLNNHPDALTPERRQSLARLYLAMGKPDLALPHVEILADQPDRNGRREWREALISLCLQLHLEEKALARAEAFTRDEPLEPKWWKTHAWLLLSRQDFRRALTSLTAYSYLQPLSGEETALLGDVNLMAGIPLEAVRFYEKQLEQLTETGLVKKTARGYLRLYDEQQALAWVETGLKLAPEDTDLLALKDYLLYRTGRND
jgi:tetratricopeptide (TPR) repeat protein